MLPHLLAVLHALASVLCCNWADWMEYSTQISYMFAVAVCRKTSLPEGSWHCGQHPSQKASITNDECERTPISLGRLESPMQNVHMIDGLDGHALLISMHTLCMCICQHARAREASKEFFHFVSYQTAFVPWQVITYSSSMTCMHAAHEPT